MTSAGSAPAVAVTLVDNIKTVCERALRSSTEYTEHLQAAIVATTDGFEVASLGGNRLQASKIAAMISTMQALGGALANEAGLNGCDNIVMETTDGVLVMRNIPTNHQLVLCFIATKSATVGHLIWCSRQCAKTIAEQLPQLSK